MPVDKKKVYNGMKILVILILVIAISFLAIMQWKSDAIVRKVMILVQSQMQDSLRYDDISLEWFRYFPSAALRIDGLNIGPGKEPFIRGGNVDVVLRLFPLLNERIVINKLNIADSRIHITKRKGHWSYDLFKKQQDTIAIDKADVTASDNNWETLVRQINLENSVILYNDGEGNSFVLDVNEGQLDGDLNGELFDGDIEMSATLDSLYMESYKQAEAFPFELTGKYKYDSVKGLQELKNIRIKNAGIKLESHGFIRNEKDRNWMDLHIAWNDGDPQVIKKLLPQQKIKNWAGYELDGKSEGQIDIQGYSSEKETPHIAFSSELQNGSVRFPGEGGQLKGMHLDVAYDNGESKAKKESYLRINLRNSSFQGRSLKANMRMNNLDQPVVDADIEGSLPASFLNFFADSSTWNFKEGVFDIDHYAIKDLDVKSFTTKTFIDKSITKLIANGVILNYHTDIIKINDGQLSLDEKGEMHVDLDELTWNKATGEKIKGQLNFAGDNVGFELTGKHSQGDVEAKGMVTGLGTKPVLKSQWKVKGIEMKELLASFSNFDQNFITSEHLHGKANVWTETTIPYDKEGNILTKDIVVTAAIDIRDGELKNMKFLEDFGKYIHMDDLRDIRFNQFKNYLKIEGGKVYMPVVFIQSSALNMSIDGVHDFDQKILYNMKINAGQAAANKLKKVDVVKRFKQARKSGWINLYYVLYGTTSDVKYEQDQKQVISAFEQSSNMKESLRNYLVDKFGHDVYWLEPNEWEDIPEYK